MGRYQPAILGGLFIGVISGLPFISIINACCCAGVIAGGVLVTYLLQQNSPVPVATSEAAIQGLLAGVIGGIVMTLITAALASVTGPVLFDQIRDQISTNNDLPPDLRDNMLRFLTGTNMMVLGVLVWVPMYAVFSMAGALLGLAFFRKKTPPPAAPPPMTPQM
jgi:hypothetical protein